MDLAALRTELTARGFTDLEASGVNTRKDAYLNRAYQELSEEEEWPWLEATASGAAPLTISDLRTIESVIDTTQQIKLLPLDRRHITDMDYSLTTAGAPGYYYVTSGTIVNVYPFTANTISVRYWKVPATLSLTTDTPSLPTRFHSLLIDGAAAYTYLDNDNYEAAREMFALYEQGKERMRESFLINQHDRPDDFVVATGASVDD